MSVIAAVVVVAVVNLLYLMPLVAGMSGNGHRLLVYSFFLLCIILFIDF